MSGKLLVGIAVGAMILGPYRITADEKKIDAKTKVVKETLKQESKSNKGSSGR